MTRDSSRTQLHLSNPRIADLFEEFNRTHLQPEEIYVPEHLQPINPEDEDDVVPDQHAAFGIQRATQKQREPAWRDLGLEELMKKGPMGKVKVGMGMRAKASSVGNGGGSGLPR